MSGRVRRWAVFAVAALAGLVALDRVAAYAATSALARHVQQSQGLAERPHVVIHGFPFITQVIRGRYSHVDVSTAVPISSGSLQVSRASAHLYGIKVNVIDAARGSVRAVPVAAGSGTATITYTALDRVLNTAAHGIASSITVTANAPRHLVLHGPLGLSLTVAASVNDGKLSLVPATGAIAALPAAIAGPLTGALGTPIPLPTFPFNLSLTTGRVTANGIVLSGTAHDSVFPVRSP